MNKLEKRIYFYVLFNLYWLLLYGQENNTTDLVGSSVLNTTSTEALHENLNVNLKNQAVNSTRTKPWHPKRTKNRTNSTMLRMPTMCETPNGDQAFCVFLKNCSKLLSQVENKSARDFLLKSRCGPNNEMPSNPKVCCGQYNNYKHLVQPDPLPKTCGQQNIVIRGRIVGGTEAKLGEFPWMARLIHKDSRNTKVFGCSGFLISSMYVLTAGHCLESENTDTLGPIFEVQLGEHNTRTKIDCNPKNTTCADKPQTIRVKKNIVHPRYNMLSTNHHHDIGLIHLRKAAKFTDYVSPICLLDKDYPEAFEYSLSGWGTTNTSTQQLSHIKMKVSLPPFPHSNCTEKYKLIGVEVTNQQICAGGMKDKDSCTGDSGGPLMLVKDKNHWFAAGVVSYGLGCGRQGWPGVYTSIPRYIDWIQQTILKRANTKLKHAKSVPKKSRKNKN